MDAASDDPTATVHEDRQEGRGTAVAGVPSILVQWIRREKRRGGSGRRAVLKGEKIAERLERKVSSTEGGGQKGEGKRESNAPEA